MESMPELLTRLKQDTVALVESEVEVAKAELFDRAKTLEKSLLPIGLGLVAAMAALIALTAAAVLWLGALLGDYALSALLVGVLLAIVAGAAVASGAKLLSRVLQPPPERGRS